MDPRPAPSIKEVLDSAANAIKRGDIAKGKDRLQWILERDPDNALAWLWMSRCVDGSEAKLKCFHRALAIDPTNAHALKGIQLISETVDRGGATSISSRFNEDTPHARPAKASTRGRKPLLVLIALLAPIVLCVFGVLVLSGYLDDPGGGSDMTASVLSAKEVFEVSSVRASENDGYTVTSAVCEFISPMSYRPSDGIFGGQLVFHAFRLTGRGLSTEAVVLFASNHTASNGSGLVIAVNSEAIGLDQGFPSGSDLADPISVDTPGADTALDCARRAGDPASLELSDKDFDAEAWRSKAIRRFGPEEIYDDGSKQNYVWYALTICELSDAGKATQRANLGEEYEGSFAEFVVETFCPHD